MNCLFRCTSRRTQMAQGRLLSYNPRNFFSESKPESEDNSSDFEETVPKMPVFEKNELGKSPLEKSTYMKLVEQLDTETQKAFERDLDASANIRAKNVNLLKEIDSLKTATEKNRAGLAKLKDLVEQERAENTRLAERMTREVQKEKIFAVSKFSQEILEVIDNMDRVLKQCARDKGSEIFNGVEMTRANALSILKRFDIHPMEDPFNQPVNLDLHEIVFHASVPSLENDMVLDVSQTGYMIGERVLRAAKVGVVKNM